MRIKCLIACILILSGCAELAKSPIVTQTLDKAAYQLVPKPTAGASTTPSPASSTSPALVSLLPPLAIPSTIPSARPTAMPVQKSEDISYDVSTLDILYENGGKATFNDLTRLSIGSNNHIYALDNSKVRKIQLNKSAQGGVITNLADNEIPLEDSIKLSSKFKDLGSIAKDSKGGIYITNIHEILYVSTDGQVSTLSKNSLSVANAQQPFYPPNNLALDAGKNLFIVYSEYNPIYRGRILKLTPENKLITLFQNGKDFYSEGKSTLIELESPDSITADSLGSLYISDQGSIYRLSANGQMTELLLSYSSSSDWWNIPSLSKRINLSYGADGDLYLTDTHNHRICRLKITGNTAEVFVIAGGKQPCTIPNNPPNSILNTQTTVGCVVDGDASQAVFYEPRGLAIDKDSNIYVADSGHRAIRKLTPKRHSIVPSPTPSPYGQRYVVTTVAGHFEEKTAHIRQDGSGAIAQFRSLYFGSLNALIIGQDNNLYVSDLNLVRKIQLGKFEQNTFVSTLAGNIHATPGNESGFEDGIGITAKFNKIGDMVQDIKGGLYVSDSHSIRYVTMDGKVTTVAGNGTPGFEDGSATQAKFNNPIGLALDSLGNLYIADNSNNRIRKLTPTGQVITVAGTGQAGFMDGKAGQAQFKGMARLALDKQGVLYISDSHGIRRLSPDGQVSTLTLYYSNPPDWSFWRSNNYELSTNLHLHYATDGDLYLTDKHMIRRLHIQGNSAEVFVVAGSGGYCSRYEPGYPLVGCNVDGDASKATFTFPSGLSTDKNGNIYVADSGHGTIRKLTPKPVK